MWTTIEGMTPSPPRVAAEPHVSDADAFAFRMERDRVLRSTIVAIAVLARSPDWDHLRRRVDRATRLVPSFRQRIAPSPFNLASPRWITDPDFDLDRHLNRVKMDEGSDLAQVLSLIHNIEEVAFDLDHPPWEITLLDGLAGGRTALVLKVHHALTDGIGGIQIAGHVVDLDRTPVEMDLPPAPLPGRHGGMADLAEAVGHDLARIADAGKMVALHAPATIASSITNPIGTAQEVARTAGSLYRLVRPVVATRSSLMTRRGLDRNFHHLDVPLHPLRAAAARVDGSLNDAFMAGVAGGFRLYHDRHLVLTNTLRFTMPVSLRLDDDGPGGNHISLVRFDLPVCGADPEHRMRQIGAACRAERREPSLQFSNQVAAALNMLPVGFVGAMLKHVDVVATNVPGFTDHVYVSGARLEAFYPFAPTLGTAANVALMSYGDTCHIGLNTDRDAVPDPELLLRCLRESFDELVALG